MTPIQAGTLVALFLTQAGPVQQVATDRVGATRSRTPSETGFIGESQTIVRLREFADRIMSFDNPGARTTAVTGLSELLWEHHSDYARQLLSRAYELLKERDAAAADGVSLRRRLIAHIAGRDPAAARQLAEGELSRAEGGDRSDTSEWYISPALRLAKDSPEKAAEFGELSLKEGVSSSIVWLLQDIQRKDPAIADGLFQKAIERLVASGSVDANDLLRLGAYVFTSPAINPSDPLYSATSGSLHMVSVGGVLVYNVSADRPGASPRSIRSFLEGAVTILSRTAPTLEQKKLYYAAAYQLLPRVNKHLPERARQLYSAMAALVPDIPPDLTQESTYSNIHNTASTGVTTLDEAVRLLEDLPNNRIRESRSLMYAHVFCIRGDYSAAREVARFINDTASRDQLLNMIGFNEAASSLARRDITAADEVAGHLKPEIERAVLLLGIAHARIDSEQLVRAAETLNAAVADIRRVDDGRRAFLLLAASAEYGRFDRLISTQVLEEAVVTFNKSSSGDASPVKWSKRIEAGTLWRDFPLRVKGIEFGFRPALSPIVAADPETAVSIVSKLKGEQELGQALVALASAMLKSKN